MFIPRAPRGGKGADKRFAAYDAIRAVVAASYCGRTDDTILMLHSFGPARGQYTSAAAGCGEAPAFAAKCDMPYAFHVPKRSIPADHVKAAVNPCS